VPGLRRYRQPVRAGCARVRAAAGAGHRLRTWDDVETIRAALEHLERWAGDLRPVLVTGACPRGADAIAERIARERGWPVEAHPARWREEDGRLDRAAGRRRNAAMAQLTPTGPGARRPRPTAAASGAAGAEAAGEPAP